VTRLRVTPAVAVGTAAAGVLLGAGALSIPCWFHALTGLDCPFCGGSRAVGALLHGDPLAALGYNAFAVVVLLPVAVAALVLLGRRELGLPTPSWPVLRASLFALGVLTVGWWILRDLRLPLSAALRV
jgi:Protein of unknown function (DUF2752)